MSKLCDIKVGRTLYGEQSYNQLLTMLSSGVVPFNAKLALSGSDHWVDLLTYEDFPLYLVGKLMLASNGYSYDSLFNHWYIKDGERSFGPFSLLQMLEFFQQNRVRLDHLVRHSSAKGWEPFGKNGPFMVESLEKLMSCEEIKSIISRRRHPRIPYTNEVFVSSRAELYRGVTWSLSSRGLGLVTDESTRIELGHRVNIIVNSNNEHGSVQIKGQVVNIKKEVNYERVAVEFDVENEFLNNFIEQRIPKL